MPMLDTLMRYNTWANREFLDKIEKLDTATYPGEFEQIIRLLDHIFVIGDIFAARLRGQTPAHTSDIRTPAPTLGELRTEILRLDQWYIDYARDIAPGALREKITFHFTDGDAGCMSREEIIAHVVLHSGYHRGEIGRLLKQVGADMPWDTFAVFLHADEPQRRLQMAS